MSKKILGLDLGTTSIGWAYVHENQNENEKSQIIKIGARIIQYGDNLVKVDLNGNITPSMTPEKDFASGKGLSPNAGRTKQRGARRNLQRYKLRRENLIHELKSNQLISQEYIASETGNASTFNTLKNRALAASEKISIEDFARVLLMINKKRGYKSSRKAKGEEEGHLIDGMIIAKQLYETNQTPGQFAYSLLQSGGKYIPDFYRSDLLNEFDRIWDFQKVFHPTILNDTSYQKIKGQKKNITSDFFQNNYHVEAIEIKGNWAEKRNKRYEIRSKALDSPMEISAVICSLIEINGEISNSSGYLGAISDRSKELFFEQITVGQYLHRQIQANSNTSLKKQIFYRLDYLDEFNTIWDNQAQFHKELTPELKTKVRDIIIFYQRRLKSQKGLVSFCEFESKEIEVIIDGKKKIKRIGRKVIPKSSPLFQEFKILQILNNIEVSKIGTGETRQLHPEEKEILIDELSIKFKLSKTEALKLLFENPKEFDLNYKEIEGNKTNATLFSAYQKIIELSGHGDYDFSKMKSSQVKKIVCDVFSNLGIDIGILEINTNVDLSTIENELQYKLWHLLYSFEGDDSKTGYEKLIELLEKNYGFEKEYGKILANTAFQPDYGSLSSKAIKKILPFLRDGFSYGGRRNEPTEPSACEYAGYRHSKSSLTKEEKENRVLKPKLDILPKNSLRNPIVEKILNQMIHVVNATIIEFGKPDEIRIELARELKKSADERKEMTEAIAKTTIEHEKYRQILQSEFGIKHVSRTDIIRYKLYLELKRTGFKTIYSNTYIAPNELFSKKFDIEHILPKAKLFDDSFSNKTLELKTVNLEKGDRTAFDFVKEKYGADELANYEKRVEDLFAFKPTKESEQLISPLPGAKTIDQRISKTKRDKLLMTESKIPSGFIDRELRDTQYIAKKAKSMLEEICKDVTSTTGGVTERLREDWQLIDIMQEINWNKFSALGLTEEYTNRDGKVIRKIKDWTKRNDHRHHAMDALTVSFTKRSHIQYLNNLNSRSDKKGDIYGIEQKELYRDKNGKLRFKPPLPLEEFRAEAKKQLENTLISFKANNKVVTKNINKFKTKNGEQSKIEFTPRGQLHLETVYGAIQQYITTEVKIGSNFNQETINKIAKKNIREALLTRLSEYGNDPKKAFTGKNSLEKNPIFLDAGKSFKVPEKVKLVTLETIYTIRKDITPDLKIDKIIDPAIKRILESRLKEFNNDPKQAFSNLIDNPIWLNKEKGIQIKRVRISGITNAISLRDKKDKNGNFILDSEGNKIATDFVNTGNNHHVAIYIDTNGDYQEQIITFYEAVERSKQGLPVINKEYNKELGWHFQFTMKRNECFIFPNNKTGFDPKDLDLFDQNNYSVISDNLYRVQKISSKNYVFNHHLETISVDGKILKERKELAGITYRFIQSLSPLAGIIKVRINHLGKIIQVGE